MFKHKNLFYIIGNCKSNTYMAKILIIVIAGDSLGNEKTYNSFPSQGILQKWGFEGTQQKEDQKKCCEALEYSQDLIFVMTKKMQIEMSARAYLYLSTFCLVCVMVSPKFPFTMILVI